MGRLGVVYRIYCVVTKKAYVGSSVEHVTRWANHKRYLNQKTHTNSFLQRAWNKYGEKQFIFEVLEEGILEESLEVREEFHTKQYQTRNRKYGFNLAPSYVGHKSAIPHEIPDTWRKRLQHNRARQKKIKWTEEQKQAQRERMRNKPRSAKQIEQAQKLIAMHVGTHLTEEHREKIRRGNLGKKMTPEAKAQMLATRKTKGPSTKQLAHCKRMMESLRNRQVSEETRAKMSVKQKERWAKRKADAKANQ